MASTFTTNLGIEKPATGDKAGTWGTATNTTFDLLDEAVDGIVTINLSSAGSSGSPNDLPITNGTSSNGRHKFIEFTSTGGDLGSDGAFVQLTPNDSQKICFFRNSLSNSRKVTIFQGTYSSSNDLELENGKDYIVKFSGAGTGATVQQINSSPVFTNVTTTSLTINGVENQGFASGVKMLFREASAPTGWTIVDTDNDKALRVSSSAGNGSGGSVAFETAFASKSVSGTVGSTTLSLSQIPSHSHSVRGSVASSGSAVFGAGNSAGTNTATAGGGGSHNHSFTGTAINLDVAYLNVIICSKA